MTDNMKIGFTGRIRVEPMSIASSIANTGGGSNSGYSSYSYGNRQGNPEGSRSVTIVPFDENLGRYVDVYA